jgi:hypothetical protein
VLVAGDGIGGRHTIGQMGGKADAPGAISTVGQRTGQGVGRRANRLGRETAGVHSLDYNPLRSSARLVANSSSEISAAS